MALYNTFQYGDGTTYGNPSKISYSVEPFYSTVLATEVMSQSINGKTRDVLVPRVSLSWASPTGNINGFRIVRNQEAYSEHEEDGVIVLETFSPAVPAKNETEDFDVSQPLITGRFAYYTIWLLKDSDNVWIPGGRTFCLIPKPHALVSPDNIVLRDSAYKFVDLLPKVFTTAQQSYLDEIDDASDLFQFLKGFSITLDELLTYADLLIPDSRGTNLNPYTIDLTMEQLGLPKESVMGLGRKKALYRNAYNLHKYKGTFKGVSIFARSITGYPAFVTPSPNLFPTIQDSSFYLESGNWYISQATGSITAVDTEPVFSGEKFSVDRTWCGQIDVTDTSGGTVYWGVYTNPTQSNPTRTVAPDVRTGAIHVLPETNYEFSFYVKGDPKNVSYTITWYDDMGELVDVYSSTPVAVTSSWAKHTTLAVDGTNISSPAGAYYATISLHFSGNGTFFIDMVSLIKTEQFNLIGSEYYEGGAVRLHFEPLKQNLILNPSFENTSVTSATNWSWDGVDSVTWAPDTTAPGIIDGSNMLELVTTGTSPFLLTCNTEARDIRNEFYTLSLYMKTDAGTEPLSISLSAWEPFVNEDDVVEDQIVRDENGTPVTVTLTPDGGVTDTWQRYQVTTYIPNVGSQVYFKIEVGTGTSNSNGNKVYFDAAQLESGTRATDYFDGSMTSRGAYWSGDANNSTSVIYRDKTVKMDRLSAQIVNYLPINTAWTISSGLTGAYVLEASGFSS